MQLISSKQRATGSYLPIFLDALRLDSVLNFDLYLLINRDMVLYRSAHLPFTDRTRQKLIENRVDRLYVSSESRRDYQRYIEDNLPQVMVDPTITENKKAGILYETSANLIRETLSNPTYGDNISRCQGMVTHTIDYILQGQAAFHNLLTITSFDYHVYTHSVNVCTFSVALAQQMGYTDPAFLKELGTGALLHDIGKSRISERILNKRTALTPIEFEIMKKHPRWGMEILQETNLIPTAAYYPVLQHHERGDKRGYPQGLSLDEMHIYSKIVAIADSFDAMTTERVYQHAMETYPALRMMLSLKNAFDEDALKAFVELMGPTGLCTP